MSDVDEARLARKAEMDITVITEAFNKSVWYPYNEMLSILSANNITEEFKNALADTYEVIGKTWLALGKLDQISATIPPVVFEHSKGTP